MSWPGRFLYLYHMFSRQISFSDFSENHPFFSRFCVSIQCCASGRLNPVSHILCDILVISDWKNKTNRKGCLVVAAVPDCIIVSYKNIGVWSWARDGCLTKYFAVGSVQIRTFISFTTEEFRTVFWELSWSDLKLSNLRWSFHICLLPTFIKCFHLNVLRTTERLFSSFSSRKHWVEPDQLLCLTWTCDIHLSWL